MSKHGSARAILGGRGHHRASRMRRACSHRARRTQRDRAEHYDGRDRRGFQRGPGHQRAPERGLGHQRAPSAAPVTSGRQSAAPVTSGRGQRETSQSFVTANSIPFPVAVGNTWVYQTTASGETGQTTNRIVSAGPGPAGYEVTMTSTTAVAGTATAVQLVYVFYPDGTIGYAVPPINGVSVAGGGIRWPDAAGLASGRAYHSVLRILVAQTGQYENADVTVQGAGTTSVSVPAGTYQASVVNTTIAAKVGGYTTTVEVTIWIAQGIGPVKTEVLIQVGGQDRTHHHECAAVLHQGGRRRDRQLNPGSGRGAAGREPRPFGI